MDEKKNAVKVIHRRRVSKKKAESETKKVDEEAEKGSDSDGPFITKPKSEVDVDAGADEKKEGKEDKPKKGKPGRKPTKLKKILVDDENNQQTSKKKQLTQKQLDSLVVKELPQSTQATLQQEQLQAQSQEVEVVKVPEVKIVSPVDEILGIEPSQKDKYALNVSTVQTGAFKMLIETLKEILDDANVKCDREGMKILALDNTETILINMKLFHDKFESFSCPKEIYLSFNVMNMYKLIKTSHNNCILTLYVAENDLNKLNITINNAEKGCKTHYSMKLFDMAAKRIQIKDDNLFKKVVLLPASYFQKLCRDISMISEHVIIECLDKKIIMSAKSDFAAQRTVLKEKAGGYATFLRNDDEIVHTVFSIKDIISFSKFSSLSNNVKLYLGNDLPLKIEYDIATLGTISLYVTNVSAKE